MSRKCGSGRENSVAAQSRMPRSRAARRVDDTEWSGVEEGSWGTAAQPADFRMQRSLPAGLCLTV
jgi:hypothetical protein